MGGTGVIDRFLEIFTSYIDSGFGLLGSEVAFLSSTLVVIGHNPTVAYLAQLLDDGEGDVVATNQMMIGYPTGAVTLLSYAGSWADLDEGTASVTAFHVGRA